MRRTLLAILAALALLLAAAAGAVGWVFSERILVPAPYGLMPEFELGAVAEGADGAYEVELPVPGEDPAQFARTDVAGRYGLLWEGGAGELGPVVAREGTTLTRTVRPTFGRPPRGGEPARVDVFVFRPDPSARGLPFREVEIPGPVGALPGWWLPGEGTDAILALHGRRRADRQELLRILPTLTSSGASVLVSSYRNHDASPPSPDGFYHWGGSEAQDALAAVRWLQARGVERVALVGFSYGATVALGALERWPEDGPEPAGLMLDSPMLAPLPVFEVGARDLGLPLPGLLTRLAAAVAGWRSGQDYAALDRRRLAPELELPVLLIAGASDATIPISLVDEFADALPRAPRYLRLEGVQHMEGWNVDPARYEAEVRAFLAEIGLRASVRPPFLAAVRRAP
jgi:hypothetical protein